MDKVDGTVFYKSNQIAKLNAAILPIAVCVGSSVDAKENSTEYTKLHPQTTMARASIDGCVWIQFNLQKKPCKNSQIRGRGSRRRMVMSDVHGFGPMAEQYAGGESQTNPRMIFLATGPFFFAILAPKKLCDVKRWLQE